MSVWQIVTVFVFGGTVSLIAALRFFKWLFKDVAA